MRERWAGPIVVVLILGGVIVFLALNLNLKAPQSANPASHGPAPARSRPPSITKEAPAPTVPQPAGFREYPIGDEVQKNEMLIKAVWLPPVQMEGMEVSNVHPSDPPRGRYSRH